MPANPGGRRRFTPSRCGWRGLTCLILLGQLLGCAPEARTVVVIAVDGLPPAVQTMRTTALLNGQTDVEIFTSSLNQFGLRLPSGASGVLGLTLEALSSDQCTIARGTGTLTLSGQSRADVSISLTAAATPSCGSPDLGAAGFPVAVTTAAGAAGPGMGLITSTPAGISCGTTCTTNFAAGVVATLSAVPSYKSLFLGWSGPCTATGGACQLVVSGATQLTAAFTATSCSLDRLCLELPVPLPAVSFRGVWGSSAKDVWVVGAGGKVLHWDGALLSPIASGVTTDLYSIWGSGPSDIWVGGASGVLLHWDGTAFSKTTLGATQGFSGIWGSGPSNVWFIDGSATVTRWNGAQFVTTGSGATGSLLGVWGSGLNDVWFVGTGGGVRHWDGVGFSAVTSGTTDLLSSVGGSSASDIYAVGAPGTIIHWDGTSFSSVANTIGDFLSGVAASSSSDVWLVGTNGAVWHSTGAAFVKSANVTLSALNAVWSSGPGEMWTVGESGAVLRRWP